MNSTKNPIPIGLNLPLFLGSLLAIVSGMLPGTLGVALYLTQGKVVPTYIKTGHAHAAWWSVFILLAALLLPALPMKAGVRRLVVLAGIVAVPVWMMLQPFGGAPGEMNLAVRGMLFGLEVWFFGSMALVLVMALGLRPRMFSADAPVRSAFDLRSQLAVPRKIFLLPLLLMVAGVAIGWALSFGFQARGNPIAPAALVQLHSHVFFFALGWLLALFVTKILGARQRAFDLVFRLGMIGLPLIVLGWVVFVALDWRSLTHLLPSVLYFAFLGVALAALFGRFGLRQEAEPHFHFARVGMIAVWIALIALSAVGPVLSLAWDTHPDVTVTYRQAQGDPYPGAYPQTYRGTLPLGGTPRGVEIIHLSPGSWSHVAMLWLAVLALFGGRLGSLVKKPTLVYLLITTIVLAPLFNAMGRVTAWAELPAGIGALFYAGQPLKYLNVLLLAVVAGVSMKRLARAAEKRGQQPAEAPAVAAVLAGEE